MNLTREEHLCAEIMAYYNALWRGGHKLPPYDPRAAGRDFCRAADRVLGLRQRYPSANTPGLYEPHPLDSGWVRPVPVALRKRPFLTISQAAVLCFDRIKDSLTDEEYWTLLGHIWVSNTKDKNNYHRSYTDLYRNLFSSKRLGRDNLMIPDEQAIFRSLPETITAYRGCGKDNPDGLSWSLSKEIAKNFSRDWNSPPWFVMKGQCCPQDVIAFFDCDHEQELIVTGNVTLHEKMDYWSA